MRIAKQAPRPCQVSRTDEYATATKQDYASAFRDAQEEQVIEFGKDREGWLTPFGTG